MSNKKLNLNKKYVWMLFVNTALLLVLYLVCVRFFPVVTLWVYTLVFAATALTYVVYNRGFTRKKLKIEDLPREWPEEEKREYIADGQRRLEKSKWMITVLLPLIVIYAYELIDLYIFPMIEGIFGKI